MTRRTAWLALVLVALFASPMRAGGQAPTWPRETPPRALPARPVDIPPYELRTLPNGLQVVVVPHHEQPSVSFRLVIRAGAMQEPADTPGVASFVSSLLTQGTSTKSSAEIASLIDSAGGIIGVGSGNELSNVYGAVIKDRTDLALGLAADLVEHPAFAAAEIDRQRRQLLSSLQVSYDDPDYLASLVFDRVVFGVHPYGRPNEGTPASIPRITREELVAFHRAWYVPNNALLAIVGDLSVDEAIGAATRAFGAWARGEVPTSAPVEPPAPTRRIVVVDRPGSAQTEIRVGGLAVTRTDPDFLTLDIAMRILGGEGANRLFGVLRTERGLTYGASAELHAYRGAGQIVARTNTRTEATGETLRLMVDEFARLAREPVRPIELEGAQDFVSGNFPLTIETPASIAQQVLAELFYGLELHEIETYRDRVNRIAVPDIQRVARAFIRPDQLSIVLVGDLSRFGDQLKALGFGDYERIAISDLDLNSPGLRRRGGRERGLPPA